jgi:DNA-directed RNA polymerase subunit RPC12/RpoP
VKFACESCGRSYAVADELRGRAFKMKCKACGHLIVVKGAPAAEPPATPKDENPFVVTPVSAAAVAAAAEAFRAAPPATAPPAEPETSRISDEAPAQGGYIDLVLDDNAPAGPAAQAGATSPAPAAPAGATSPASAATSLEGPAATAVRPPPLPRRTGGSQPPRAEGGPAGPPAAPARLRFAAARRAVSGRKAIVAGGVAVAAAVALAVLAMRTGGGNVPAAPARPVEAAASSPPVPSPAPVEAAPPATARPEPDRAGEVQPARRRASESRPKRERPPTVAKEERAEPEQPAAAPAGPGPEAAPAPAGVAATGGPPSSEEIGRIVTAHRQAFESCISEAVRRDPGLDLSGRQVLLTLTVNPAGTVDTARLDDADLDQSELGACLKSSARRMAFPAYQGSPMQVEVPLSLGRGG